MISQGKKLWETPRDFISVTSETLNTKGQSRDGTTIKMSLTTFLRASWVRLWLPLLECLLVNEITREDDSLCFMALSYGWRYHHHPVPSSGTTINHFHAAVLLFQFFECVVNNYYYTCKKKKKHHANVIQINGEFRLTDAQFKSRRRCIQNPKRRWRRETTGNSHNNCNKFDRKR